MIKDKLLRIIMILTIAQVLFVIIFLGMLIYYAFLPIIGIIISFILIGIGWFITISFYGIMDCVVESIRLTKGVGKEQPIKGVGLIRSKDSARKRNI